jgi:phosphatidylglycerophosphate synthase
VPNLLTFSRLIAAPFIGYAILHDAHTWALGLFVYAGVSDLLDGWIARKWNLQTVVGSVVDPMADKILMTILTVCLAVKGALPRKLCLLISATLLLIAKLYYFGYFFLYCTLTPIPPFLPAVSSGAARIDITFFHVELCSIVRTYMLYLSLGCSCFTLISCRMFIPGTLRPRFAPSGSQTYTPTFNSRDKCFS